VRIFPVFGASEKTKFRKNTQKKKRKKKLFFSSERVEGSVIVPFFRVLPFTGGILGLVCTFHCHMFFVVPCSSVKQSISSAPRICFLFRGVRCVYISKTSIHTQRTIAHAHAHRKKNTKGTLFCPSKLWFFSLAANHNPRSLTQTDTQKETVACARVTARRLSGRSLYECG